jgi:ATP-dependent Clp protease ATP-binding subunit ClpA
VFERFTEPADQVMGLACEEADRLRHDYLGPEHVLAGLARQEGSRAAAILRASGLDAVAVRAGLDRLVTEGTLPPAWRNKADLLRSLGIDLPAVQRSIEESFGTQAMCAATRRALGHSWLREDRLVTQNPLAGKAMLTKRAFSLAAHEADALGSHHIGPEHLLLGVLRDAQSPGGRPRLGRRVRRVRAHLGLPQHGPSPVRLIIEANGGNLDSLRAELLAQLHAPA